MILPINFASMSRGLKRLHELEAQDAEIARMPTRTPLYNRTEPTTAIPCRTSDRRKLAKVTASYRGLKVADTVGLLLCAWNTLTKEQQDQIFLSPRPDPDKEPQ